EAPSHARVGSSRTSDPASHLHHGTFDFRMRFGLILLLLVFAALGAVFGALNGESVAFDFYFATLNLPKGAALLCALLLGWLAGGLLVYLGLVLRLRRRVKAQARKLRHREEKKAVAVVPVETTPTP
ncbi:MAG TPA: lipopolysaccharide assembly protein LapA domain-containing protein, partial [Rudaea sp.]